MPPRGGGRGARLRAIVLRAAGAVAIAALLWWRDHERAAVVLLALAATLTVAASLSPALAAAAERVEAVIRRYAGRFLSLVFLTAVYLLVFLPLSLLLRLFAVNPLQLGRSADDQSAWRPAQKHPRRPLYKRPFAYDRIPHTAASRGLRLRAALGLIIIIIALDLALGAALDAFDGSDAPSAQNSEVNLVSAPDTPAGATEPWRAQLGQEIGQAWVHKRYDPFLGWRMLDYRGRYVNLSDGVRRSYEAPGAGGPDAVTVYFMGGSTMFGLVPARRAHDPLRVRAPGRGATASRCGSSTTDSSPTSTGRRCSCCSSWRAGRAGRTWPSSTTATTSCSASSPLGHHREPTTLDAQEIEKRLALGTAPDDPSSRGRAAYDAWEDESAVYRLGRELGLVGGRPRGRRCRPPGPPSRATARPQRGTDAVEVQRRGVDAGARSGRHATASRRRSSGSRSIYSKRVVTGRGGAARAGSAPTRRRGARPPRRRAHGSAARRRRPERRRSTACASRSCTTSSTPTSWARAWWPRALYERLRPSYCDCRRSWRSDERPRHQRLLPRLGGRARARRRARRRRPGGALHAHQARRRASRSTRSATACAPATSGPRRDRRGRLLRQAADHLRAPAADLPARGARRRCARSTRRCRCGCARSSGSRT